MSEPLRVALIAEGNTDAVVIEAALKATLKEREFILTLLQPEPTRPTMGGGWAGVFKWCRDFAGRGSACLEKDPTRPGFDLFLIHLDADVAGMRYADCGAAVADAAQALLPLPCEEPCPPPFASVEPLRARLRSWLGLPEVGARTVLCIPSKSSEAWLASAALPKGHRLLVGIECNQNLAAQLASLPREEKMTKQLVHYRERAPSITRHWEHVVSLCEEAKRFAAEVVKALDSRPIEASDSPNEPQDPKEPEVGRPAVAAAATEPSTAAQARVAPGLQVVADAAPAESSETTPAATLPEPAPLPNEAAATPGGAQEREDAMN